MAFMSNLNGPHGGAAIGVPTRGPTSAKPRPSSGGLAGWWNGLKDNFVNAQPSVNNGMSYDSGSAQQLVNHMQQKGDLPLFASGVTSGPATNKPRPSSGGSRPSGGSSGVAPSASGIDYLYADLAKHYGFSKETAYQEALSNTQYSRAVEDMQRAGLNPASIFGSGKGYTAGDDIWPTSPGGGGGSAGGGGRRSGGRGSSGGRLFSNSAYAVISAVSGAVGAIVTKNPSGYWIGTSLAQGAMNAMDAISKWGR